MPAGSTYTPIATTTLGSAQNSVTFSSIAGTYTDLKLIVSSTLASSQVTLVQFNGDTGNYSQTRIYGDGTNVTSDRQSLADIGYSGSASPSVFIVDIMNYSNSTTFKTLLSRWNTAGNTNFVGASVSLWRSTSAINSVKILNLSSVNFQTGSTFTLYGIASA